MVLSNDLVLLQIPAFHHLVFAAGEEVRVTIGDGEAADGADVAREGELEFAGGEVPDLHERRERERVLAWTSSS